MKNTCLKIIGLLSLFPLLSVTLIKCGGGIPLPSGARNAAEMLLDILSDDSFSYADSYSSIHFTGPVTPGTLVRENYPEDSVELQVPETEGTYYVFFIDDTPADKFEHPVSYVWVNIDTGDYEYVDASYRFILYPPDIDPRPFEQIAYEEINDTPFYFYEGENAPRIFEDMGNKPVFEKPTFTSLIDKNTEGVKTFSESSGRPPVRKAVVIDAGDADFARGGKEFRKAFVEEAEMIAKWLRENPNNFDVERLSQAKENNYAYLNVRHDKPGETSEYVKNVIASYGNEFRNLGPPGEYCDNFFLFITGHSIGIGEIHLHDPWGGFAKRVSYSKIFEGLKNFPEWVKVTIFLDLCDCGEAITLNKPLIKDLNDNYLCALTIITTVDDTHNSATRKFLKDFLDDKRKVYDIDKDGIKGDIKDRWYHMYFRRIARGENKCTEDEQNRSKHMEECKGRGYPLRWVKPELKSWCILDGQNTEYTGGDQTGRDPVADAGRDQIVPLGSTVQLDGSNSFDPDGDPIEYYWQLAKKPNGSTASLEPPAISPPSDQWSNAEKPTFVCDKVGQYELNLHVQEKTGSKRVSKIDTVTITCLPTTTTTTCTKVSLGNDDGTAENSFTNGPTDCGLAYVAQAFSLNLPYSLSEFTSDSCYLSEIELWLTRTGNGGDYRLTVWTDHTGGSPDDADIVWQSEVQTVQLPEWPDGEWVSVPIDGGIDPIESGSWVIGVELLSDNMSTFSFTWVGMDDSTRTDPDSWGFCENQGGWKSLEGWGVLGYTLMIRGAACCPD